MSLFERFDPVNYRAREAQSMPENTNCIRSYSEQNIWDLFVLHCHNQYNQITSWTKIERSFYKAVTDDNRVIFFSTDFFERPNYRIYTIEQAKFENEQEWISEFCARFRYLMETRRLNQKELSQLSGISESSLSYYHHGMRVPTAYVIRRLALAFDCSLNFLMMCE